MKNWNWFKFTLHTSLPFSLAIAKEQMALGNVGFANAILTNVETLLSDLEQFFVQHSAANN